jgi:hypothetical protein
MDCEYSVWSDFLAGNAEDIFPGDALNVAVPSRGASFPAIVSVVEITMQYVEGEHLSYKITSSNDAAKAVAFEFESSKAATPFVNQLTEAEVGTTYFPDLTAAAITQVSSTAVTVNAGVAPISGGGIEVRWSDTGWGPENERNLVGPICQPDFLHTTTIASTTCYLQQYDASVPPKYSRNTAALHVDCPL